MKKQPPKLVTIKALTPQILPEQKQKSLPPDTTEEQDIVTAGQRKINLIWETTQSKIALISIISSQVVNLVVIVSMLYKTSVPDPARIAVITASVAAMNLTVGIIIGFYFSRTNHSSIGGVGKKTQISETGTR